MPVNSIEEEIRRLIIKKHLNIPSDKVRFVDHSSGHIYYSFFYTFILFAVLKDKIMQNYLCFKSNDFNF